MTDRDGPRSNPYHPDPDKCCEACVFGGARHADWCDAIPPGALIAVTKSQMHTLGKRGLIRLYRSQQANA